MEADPPINGGLASEEARPVKVIKQPSNIYTRSRAKLGSIIGPIWDKTSHVLNFEFLKVPRWPAFGLFTLIVVGLAVAVGVTAVPVKNGVTLGVEFGGGYTMLYACKPRNETVSDLSATPTVDPTALTQQASQMYDILVEYGMPNSKVTALQPNKVSVIIPGVTDKKQIGPVLDAFETLPLEMEIRSARSMSGSMGTQDLHDTILAAGVAMGIVWACLIFRYSIAGLLGFFLCVVYIWLHLLFFNASSYALSDAAIVAVVLNIGLGADAHIIAFEQVRLNFGALPRDPPEELRLHAMERGLRIALVTVLEANVSTILAMVVLYGVGTGPTVEFAFTVMISVCASMLVNVLLARLLMRLAFFGRIIETGQFFGDKGPPYDEDRKEFFKRLNRHLLIPHWPHARKVRFDFIRFWWIGGFATGAVLIAGIVCLCTKGLNWGVDYTAGTSMSMVIPPPYTYTCGDIIQVAEFKTNATVSTCSIADQGHVDLRFKEAVDPHVVKLISYRVFVNFGGPVPYNEYTIDNTLAKDQSRRAIIAMIVAAVVTCAFLLLRFGPGFSLAGFLSLASSGLFAICCFAMGGYEVNLPIISAVLTVFSYAINDCVVVFDRIRFDLAALPEPPTDKQELRDTVNQAMGSVTIRSLLTLAVVMVCSICLVGLGPPGLESFSLAITFGLLNASYTTLLICAPFWYLLRKWVLHYEVRKARAAGLLPPAQPAIGAAKSDASKLESKLGNGSSVGSFRRLASSDMRDSGSAGSKDVESAVASGSPTSQDGPSVDASAGSAGQEDNKAN